MTQSLEQIALQISRRARRALAALLISGSLFSTVAWGDSSATDDAIGSGAVAKVDDHTLDYWIFSDDYCGWASAEALVSPPNRSLAAKATVDSVTVADLAELAAQEPVDVTLDLASTALVDIQKVIGSAPVIVTIAEGYLSYDLSHADQISLRMRPISAPPYGYVGDGRSAGLSFAGRGPLDCLGYGLVSDEVVAPPTVSTSMAVRASDSIADQWNQVTQVADLISADLSTAIAKSDAERRELVLSCVAAIQPASSVRQSIEPTWLGEQVGVGVGAALAKSQAVLHDVSNCIAANWPSTVGRAVPGTSTMPGAVGGTSSQGEQLLIRAGLDPTEINLATNRVADTDAVSACCPVEQLAIAAQPPASQHLAAVGVAAATLNLPQESATTRDPVMRAEAIATACDSVAATLEQWALALRRAGDSVVRVAKGSVGAESAMR